MAKAGKPRPKRKTARRPGTSKTAPTPRKAASTVKAVKPAQADPLDRFMEAASRVLDLPVKAAWRPAIKANLEVTLRFAALVEEFASPDEAEPAPIFRA